MEGTGSLVTSSMGSISSNTASITVSSSSSDNNNEDDFSDSIISPTTPLALSYSLPAHLDDSLSALTDLAESPTSSCHLISSSHKCNVKVCYPHSSRHVAICPHCCKVGTPCYNCHPELNVLLDKCDKCDRQDVMLVHQCVPAGSRHWFPCYCSKCDSPRPPHFVSEEQPYCICIECHPAPIPKCRLHENEKPEQDDDTYYHVPTLSPSGHPVQIKLSDLPPPRKGISGEWKRDSTNGIYFSYVFEPPKPTPTTDDFDADIYHIHDPVFRAEYQVPGVRTIVVSYVDLPHPTPGQPGKWVKDGNGKPFYQTQCLHGGCRGTVSVAGRDVCLDDLPSPAPGYGGKWVRGVSNIYYQFNLTSGQEGREAMQHLGLPALPTPSPSPTPPTPSLLLLPPTVMLKFNRKDNTIELADQGQFGGFSRALSISLNVPSLGSVTFMWGAFEQSAEYFYWFRSSGPDHREWRFSFLPTAKPGPVISDSNPQKIIDAQACLIALNRTLANIHRIFYEPRLVTSSDEPEELWQ